MVRKVSRDSSFILTFSFHRNNSSKRMQMQKEQDRRRRKSRLPNYGYKKVGIAILDAPGCSAPLQQGSAAEAFRTTDLQELEGTLGRTMKTTFPNPDDILNFTLTIEPDEGMYKGGSFHFSFAINQNFPHDPPKVKCKQKIYHPNIDLEGNVCLNILREDWKPVLNLNAVIVGLQVCQAQPRKIAQACDSGWTKRCAKTISSV